MSYPPQPPHNPAQPPGGWVPPPPPPQQGYFPQQPAYWQQPQPLVIPATPFNHGKHVIVDFCTFGIWIPFHLLFWACHPRKARVVQPKPAKQPRR